MADAKKKVTSLKIDPELWKQAKVYCAENSTTLSELMEDLLRKELVKGKKGQK